jgi:hypothetical protein
MCPQKDYSIMKSKDRRFMPKNAENDAQTEGIKSDMKNYDEKLLKHHNFAPTLSGA